MATFTVTRLDYQPGSPPAGSLVNATSVVTVNVGPRGPAGPNSISDSTAVGTLSGVTDGSSVIVVDSTGLLVRKTTPTAWGWSNLLATVPAGRVPFAHTDGTVTSNAGLTFNDSTGATLTSNVQDASSVAAALRTTVVSYRDSTPVQWTWFRGRLVAMNPPLNVPSLVFGNPFGSEASGFLGDGLGSIIGNGGVGVWTQHTARAAWYIGAQLMKSDTHLAWCPGAIGSPGGDAGFIRDSLNTMRVTNGSTGVGGLITGPLTVQQTGGTAGVDEVQVYHNGAEGFVRSVDGYLNLYSDGIRFIHRTDFNSFAIAPSGNSAFFQIAGGNSFLLRSAAFEQRSDGVLAWQNSTNTAAGTKDTELTRSSAGFVGLGSTTNRVVVGHDGTNGVITASTGVVIVSTIYSATAANVDANWGVNAFNKLRMTYTGGMYATVGAVDSFSAHATGLALTAANTLVWNANSTPGSVGDTRLRRSAAGVLRIDSGTDGQDRDLVVRYLYADRLTPVGTGDLTVAAGGSGTILMESAVYHKQGTVGWNGNKVGFAVTGNVGNDVALYCQSAGVLEINNGTAGQYRDLRLRRVYLPDNEAVYWYSSGGTAARTMVASSSINLVMFGDIDGTLGYGARVYTTGGSTTTLYQTGNLTHTFAHTGATTATLNNAGTVGHIIDLHASQTADAFRVTKSGSTLASVSATGLGTFAGLTVSSGIDLDVRVAATHGLTVRSTGGGRAIRVMSADLGTEYFVVDSNGIPTLGANKYIDFNDGNVGDPNMIITAGGTGLGISTNGSLIVATGGTTRTMTLDTSGNLSVTCLGTFAGVTVSNLTAGRVPYVSTAGLIADDAGLTYDATTDTLSLVGPSGTALVASTGAGGVAPYLEIGQNGTISGGSVRLMFTSPKLGLARYSGGSPLDHFVYYSTSTGDTVLDCVFSGAGSELRYLGTTRIRVNSTGIGLYGVTPVARQTAAADATDLATAITLVNDLKAKLITLGAIQ